MLTLDGDWLAGIAERLAGKIGFEDDHISVRELTKPRGETPRGVEPVAAGGAVEELRRVKDERRAGRDRRGLEAGRRRREADRRSGAWPASRARSRPRCFEEKDPRLRRRRSPSDTIVAAGPNGALPHAEPGEREIGKGELIVFDMGAKLDGYCSDGTRTYATGDPGEEGRRVYETVLAAQQAALEAIRAGAKGEDVDAVARGVIDGAGHGEHFGHGLGHGVGLDIHEGPRLSLRSDDVLAVERSGHGRAGDLPARRPRRADRGPGRRHRGRHPQPQLLPKDLRWSTEAGPVVRAVCLGRGPEEEPSRPPCRLSSREVDAGFDPAAEGGEQLDHVASTSRRSTISTGECM